MQNEELNSGMDFLDTIDMHMKGMKKKSPIRITNLNFKNDWGKSLIVLSNIQPKNSMNEQITLLEVGNYVTHNAGFSVNRNEDGIMYHKIYRGNIISRKAMINVENFQRVNLGQFKIRSVSNNTNENTEYSVDKVYYFGDDSLVSLQMEKF